MKYESFSSEQTKKIASDFAKTLKGGEVVLLEGDLGSGKTTFVQGLAEALGVEEPVRSPTFTIMNLYKIKHDQIKQIAHFDFYRLEQEADLEDLGLEEWLGRDDTVVLIEWPKGEFPVKHQTIKFEIKNEKTRIIHLPQQL